MSLHTMLGSPCPGEGIWNTTPSLLRFKVLKAKRGEFPASYFLQHFGVQRRGAPFQHPIFCEGTLSSKRQGVSSTLFFTIRLCPAPRGPFPAPCLLGGNAFQQKAKGFQRQFIYSTLAPSETAGCCFLILGTETSPANGRTVSILFLVNSGLEHNHIPFWSVSDEANLPAFSNKNGSETNSLKKLT